MLCVGDEPNYTYPCWLLHTFSLKQPWSAFGDAMVLWCMLNSNLAVAEFGQLAFLGFPSLICESEVP